ncbi:MAG TPA: ABC transporter ATP-binding protein [Thermoplasmata archaeon]
MVADVVSLVDATKRYGDREALRGVTFRVGAGEAVGYLGPNGAGKTTTLRLLSGLSRVDSGSVLVLGRDPIADHASALTGVGVLVETPGVVPYVTGADLLDHIAEVKRVPAPERAGHLHTLAETMGVAGHLHRPMGALSTGLARRVLLAGALVGDPELLLLDEPTLGLDPAARDDLRRVLRSLKASGRSILLSTHLLEDVEEVCDRVLFLRDGRLVGDEAVQPTTMNAQGLALRALRIRFSEDVEPGRVAPLEGAVDRLERPGPREVLLYFPGDERRATELIAIAVRSGLPVTSASEPTAELGRRYLERVGREDPT